MEQIVALLLVMCAALLSAQVDEGEVFPLDILIAPTSQVVSGSKDSADFYCTMKGLAMEWIVTADHSTDQQLMADGVIIKTSERMAEQIISVITIPTTTHFNATRLRCMALNSTQNLSSAEAVMIIAGPPLPPNPQLDMTSTTELEVSWDEPFTWDQFPVLNYTITVYNDSGPSGRAPHTYTVTEPSKLFTLEAEMTSCPVLSFRVSATNEIGESRNGNVSGGFPVVPDDFASVPTVSTSSETSKVQISFRPPLVCSFQEAYYKVKVYSAGFGNVVYDGEFPHVYGDKVVTTDITSELQTDAHYCAIVSFSTHDQLTSISANVSFMVGADLPSVSIERVLVVGNGKHKVTLCVKLPVLCPFQRVTYKIIISYQEHHVLESQREFSYSSGYNGECIDEEIVTEKLQEGREYAVFVTMDSEQILNSSTPVTLKPTSSSEDAEGVAWTSDTVVIAALVMIIIILIGIIIITCIALKHYHSKARALANRPKGATNRVFEAYQLSFDGPIYHTMEQSAAHPHTCTGSLLESPTNTEPLYHILEPTPRTALCRSQESPTGDNPTHLTYKAAAGTLV